MTGYASSFLALAIAATSACGTPFGAPKVADAFREPSNPNAMSTGVASLHRLGNAGVSSRECSAVTVEVLARCLDGVPQKVTKEMFGATVHYQAFVKDGTGAVIDSFGWSGTPVVGGDGHVLAAEDELHRYADYDGNDPRWQATMPLDTYRFLRAEWEAKNDGQGYAMLNSGKGGLTEPLKTGRTTDNEQLKMSMEVYEKNCQRALFEFAEMARTRSDVRQTVPFSYPAGVVLADAIRGAVRDSNSAAGTPPMGEDTQSAGATIDFSKLESLVSKQASFIRGILASGEKASSEQQSQFNSLNKQYSAEFDRLKGQIAKVSDPAQRSTCYSKLASINSRMNSDVDPLLAQGAKSGLFTIH